jgi:hypothetical protein
MGLKAHFDTPCHGERLGIQTIINILTLRVMGL